MVRRSQGTANLPYKEHVLITPFSDTVRPGRSQDRSIGTKREHKVHVLTPGLFV